MFFKKLFKKVNKITPPQIPLLDKRGEGGVTDPLWESFRRADGDWCCRVFNEMIKSGSPFLTVQTPERDMIVMTVRYCPRCGRKL
jgi:hypothetical protein